MSLILLTCLNVQTVSGEEIGFNVQAKLPENQQNQEISYYDLRMQPAQQQEITMTIFNTSNQEQTYEINVNQAYTNKNGFIDYERNDIEVDASQKYRLADIATYAPEITVSPQTSIDFSIQLTMPEEVFDGEILGGIQVLKKTKEVEGEIVNRYGYIIGLRLTETDTPVQRKLEVNEVRAEKTFGSTGIVAEIQNPTMEGIGHLKYDVEIKNKQEETVRKKTFDKDMSIAPNSTYDFAVDWEEESLEAGDYVLHLVIADAKGNHWTFDEPFVITEEEAEKINQSLLPIAPSNNNPSWPFVLLGMLSGLAVSLLLLYLRKRKQRQQALTVRLISADTSAHIPGSSDTL
nr:DUF916 and DUF3324 domain-containing protein [Enterococcus sp. BWR-S5]